MRALVTAGGTREPIDRVRDWGNRFTGGTGLAIARAVAARGGDVDLVTSNADHAEALEAEGGPVHPHRFTTHAELVAAIDRLMAGGRYDAVFMTAAVGDYLPSGAYRVVSRRREGDNGREVWEVENAGGDKVSSTHDELAVVARRAEKIIDLFRSRWAFTGMLFKFKLEAGVDEQRLREIARASRAASGADVIVANTLEMLSGDDAGAWVIGDESEERVPRGELASRLAELAAC